MFRKRAVDAAAILGLLAASLLFFGDVLFPPPGEVVSGRDAADLFAPLLSFAFAAFRDGRLPLWNPHIFLGFPQYAEPQFSTFYPLVWLLSGLEAATAISWLYAIHFGLTAVGGYLLARQLGGRWAAGLITGFVLAFNAFMAAHVYAGHLPHVMTLAYAPWLLAAAAWAAKPRPGLRAAAAAMLAAVPLALALLAGYAPFFPFLATAVTLLMFWLAGQAWQKSGRAAALRIVGQWAGLGVFAGLLAAVQLLPTVEFALRSTRAAGADYAFASSFSLPFWGWLTLLLPDLYGSPAGPVAYWSGAPVYLYWEAAFYVGILPLALFALAWPLGRRSWRFWIGVGAAGLVVALGAAGGLHFLLYQIAPGFRLFRVPARITWFFVLAAALLAGLMWERWLALPEETLAAWRPFLRRGMAAGLALLALLLGASVLWQAAQSDGAAAARINGVTNQLARLALLGAASGGLLFWARGRDPRYVVWPALALLLVDLWGYGGKLVVLRPFEPGWAMADLALPPEREAYRVMAGGFFANGGLPYGFYNVDGYDDFRPEMAQTLAEAAYYDAGLARLLGARYLLYGPDREAAPAAPGWELLTQPPGVTIFERQDVLPRAFVVHQVLPAADPAEALRLLRQPGYNWGETAVVQVMPETSCAIAPGDPAASRARITSYEPERVVLQTDTAAAGWLVLTDLYYPGWRATVDGVETAIQPTDYGLRGICLPAGQHEVVFTFRPQIFYVGRFISGVSLGLLALAGLFFGFSWKF